jgi:hypothetical protein
MAIKDDIERNHRTWARADIMIVSRTVTDRDEVFGDPEHDDEETVVSGVYTEKQVELEATVGGGVVTGDAELRVLPDVEIDEGDLVKVLGKTYRVSGVALAHDGTEVVEKVAALDKRLSEGS